MSSSSPSMTPSSALTTWYMFRLSNILLLLLLMGVHAVCFVEPTCLFDGSIYVHFIYDLVGWDVYMGSCTILIHVKVHPNFMI
jgi:hypothetical protein